MTLRPLRHALNASGLPARAYGSEGGGGDDTDETPPAGQKSGADRPSGGSR